MPPLVIFALLAVFIALNVLDVTSTNEVLKSKTVLDAHEANPLMRWLQHRLGVYWPAARLAPVWPLCWLLWKHPEPLGVGLIFMLSLVLIGVVINNLSIARRAN